MSTDSMEMSLPASCLQHHDSVVKKETAPYLGERNGDVAMLIVERAKATQGTVFVLGACPRFVLDGREVTKEEFFKKER